MTHWAEKIVSNTEWALVQDAFEKQFVALGSPRDMMLIAVEGQADATRLIIGLPRRYLLVALRRLRGNQWRQSSSYSESSNRT